MPLSVGSPFGRKGARTSCREKPHPPLVLRLYTEGGFPGPMAFTTSVVGSFPRPKPLIDAFASFERGELGAEALEAQLQDAVRDTIQKEESAGLDVITDGEQRRSSFVAFVGQKIPGFRLVHVTKLNAHAREIMEEHKAQLTLWRAIAVDRIRPVPIAADELAFAKTLATRPLKVTLPSPYLLMWETWHAERSRASYLHPEDLAADCVPLIREEILRLRAAGAAFVQLDEPMVGDLVEADADKPDRYRRVAERIHGQRYRGFRNELALARDLINETVHGVAGVRIGMHLDRWPNPDSPHYGEGYERLLPYVLDVKVQQYVLEYASPGSGDPKRFVEHLPSDREIGLGVVDVRNRAVEDPSVIVARVERILGLVDPERVWLNPDCGFAPGMHRTFPRDVAFEKLRSMVSAARRLRTRQSR